ncbi:hypothetical protein TYRP_006263 [Tyrophagus putrescentiae]|nr:hypothetical protein TYRP_006263 [Tyrophagus putrescentiae]
MDGNSSVSSSTDDEIIVLTKFTKEKLKKKKKHPWGEVLEVTVAEGVITKRFASLSLITDELKALDELDKKKEKNASDENGKSATNDHYDQDFVDVEPLMMNEATLWLTDCPVFSKRNTEDSSFELLESGNNDTVLLTAIVSDLLPSKLRSIQVRDGLMMQSIANFNEDEDEEMVIISPSLFPDKTPHQSAFVRVILGRSEANCFNEDSSSRLFSSPNCAFLSRTFSGQVLRQRLADNEYFLSTSCISRGSTVSAKGSEVEVELQLMMSSTMKKNENPIDPSFETARILEEPIIFSTFSAQSVGADGQLQQQLQHSSSLLSMGVPVVERTLADLVKDGVLFVGEPSKDEPNRITLCLAPWLSVEKDLPWLLCDQDDDDDEEKEGVRKIKTDKQPDCDLGWDLILDSEKYSLSQQLVDCQAVIFTVGHRGHQGASILADPSHCLLLLGSIQARVDEDDVVRLGQVQAIGGKGRRQQQHIDIVRMLERLNVSCKVAAGRRLLDHHRFDVTFCQSQTDSAQQLWPGGEEQHLLWSAVVGRSCLQNALYRVHHLDHLR